MDRDLGRLERAHAQQPDDDLVAVELARAYRRLGRPAAALRLARSRDPVEREASARALAEAMDLTWLGVELGQDRFRRADHDLVLVPGGAVLDDGAAGVASSLLERQSRADLRRVVVPDVLLGLGARPLSRRDSALAVARELRGRLPSPAEWKKLWRGGVHLDGDDSARVPNPDPDRLVPVTDRGPSAYGACFDPLGAKEWTSAPDLACVFDLATGRYQESLPPADPRVPRLAWLRRLVWRLAVDVPG